MKKMTLLVSDINLVQTFVLTCVIVIMIPIYCLFVTGTKIQDSSTAQKKCGSWISTAGFASNLEKKRELENWLKKQASKSKPGKVRRVWLAVDGSP